MKNRRSKANLRIFKRLPALVLAFFVIFAVPVYAAPEGRSQAAQWPECNEISSGSALVIEANTGAVLYSKDPGAENYPASTTKLLTCLVALEHCSLNETVTFSENAVTLEDGASNIGTVAGEQLSVKDCLYGLMVASGNDCANAIAEHVAGSVEAFVDMMNEKAASLGCENSHFMNPHGLFHYNHYTTASDLCKIAQAAFNNSALVEIISHPSYTIGPTNMYKHERILTDTHLMAVPNSDYYNEYVIGGKTGWLVESGRTLVTLAKKDGMTVIAVVLYCAEYYGVFDDTQELLDYAFNNFTIKNISENETRFNFSGADSKVLLDSSSQLLMPNNIEFSDLTSTLSFAYDMDKDTFDAAKEKAGLTARDGRHLYATIDYSCGDHYLGSMNVLTDDNLKVSKTSFADIHYINLYKVLAGIFIGVVVVVAFFIISNTLAQRRAIRRRRAAAKAAARGYR